MNWKDWREKWVMFSMTILIPCMVIFVVGFTIVYPMWVAHIEFDRIYDDAMEDLYNGNNTEDFKLGWIAALKHFKVLWNSGSNATYAIIDIGE